MHGTVSSKWIPDSLTWTKNVPRSYMMCCTKENHISRPGGTVASNGLLYYQTLYLFYFLKQAWSGRLPTAGLVSIPLRPAVVQTIKTLLPRLFISSNRLLLRGLQSSNRAHKEFKSRLSLRLVLSCFCRSLHVLCLVWLSYTCAVIPALVVWDW